jgi:hypothetical protein
MDDPSERHFQALKKLLRYLAGHRNLSIRYYNGDAPDDEKRQLEAWVDSNWAQCPDTRRSRTGVVFTHAGNVVHYRSSMQKSVATSSSEAGYVAAGVAAKDLKWLRSLAQEWRVNLDITPTPLQSTKLHIDNSGAIAMSTSNGPTRRSKHVDIQHHFLNEQVQAGVIRPTNVPIAEQKADLFTKPLAKSKFLSNTLKLQAHLHTSRESV